MKTAPQEFANYLNSIGQECPTKDWNKHHLWDAWKAGYNACVERVNRQTMEKYGMSETAKRVFR